MSMHGLVGGLLVVCLASVAQAETPRSRALWALHSIALGQKPGGESLEAARLRWNDSEPPPLDEKRERDLDDAIRQIYKSLTAKYDWDMYARLRLLLAKFWAEKSHYVSTHREWPAYVAATAEWRECRQQRKDCGREPSIDRKSSELARDEAIENCRWITKRDPKTLMKAELFQIFVEARLLLGSLLMEKSKDVETRKARRALVDEAMAVFRGVVELAPESGFAADALIAMGDEHWDRNELKAACAAFEKAVSISSSSELYARYMVATCQMSRGDRDQARAGFEATVERAAKAKGKSARLKKRALQSLAALFASEESFETATAYFTAAVGESEARVWRTAVARGWLDPRQCRLGLEAFRVLLSEAPDHAMAPTWMAGVVVSAERCRLTSEATAAARELVQRFGAESEWRKQNSTDGVAGRLAEEAVKAAQVFASP